jgi:hypothetical protein
MLEYIINFLDLSLGRAKPGEAKGQSQAKPNGKATA